tara:strand:- start:1448 stop:1687 length:240 start_codon:yes stop_codon:yes gene_type:complete
MTIEAQGEWIVLEKQEKKSGSFIVIEGNSGTVVSVGPECPESFNDLIGKEVVYSQTRTHEVLDGYIAVIWREIFWKVKE